MPGCGKSTIGVLLAKSLGYNFIDTDIIIQNRENRFLQDIINSDGIDRFLDSEQEAILSLKCKNHIIATGGSVVLREKSMMHLKNLGAIVYIDVDLEELIQRITNITTRGIVIEHGQTLADVYLIRTPLYKKYADVTVYSCKKSLEETVSDIVYLFTAQN